MSVTLLVTISGKPGHGKALAEMLQPVPAGNDIDGCLGMKIFVNTANADEVLILEEWSSIEAHKAFLAGVMAEGGLDEMLKHAAGVNRTYFNAVQD